MGGWGPMFGTKSQINPVFLTPSLILNYNRVEEEEENGLVVEEDREVEGWW